MTHQSDYRPVEQLKSGDIFCIGGHDYAVLNLQPTAHDERILVIAVAEDITEYIVAVEFHVDHHVHVLNN